MQKYQGLILFNLFITIVYANIKINSFQPYQPGSTKDKAGLYANTVRLWASISGCSSTQCQCEVKIDGLDDSLPVINIGPDPEDGTGSVSDVFISNLESNRNYTAILTCGFGQSQTSANLAFKTDYKRPSAPQNITASLTSQHIKITWLPPSVPDDSFTNYSIEIDGKHLIYSISKKDHSYEVPDIVYRDGAEYTFYVRTCYTNNQDLSICSNREDGKVVFLKPIILTTEPSTNENTSTIATTTTTTAKSFATHMSSISIIMILFSFLLNGEIF